MKTMKCAICGRRKRKGKRKCPHCKYKSMNSLFRETLDEWKKALM